MATISAPRPLFCCSEVHFTFTGHEFLEPNTYTHHLLIHAGKSPFQDPAPKKDLSSEVCKSGIIAMSRTDVLEQSLWEGIKRSEPRLRYFTIRQTDGSINGFTEIAYNKFRKAIEMGCLSKGRNFSTFACSTHTGASFSVYWYNAHFPLFRDEIDAQGRYLAGLAMQNPFFPTAYEVLQAERYADLVEREGIESHSALANRADWMLGGRWGRVVVGKDIESSASVSMMVPQMPSTLEVPTSTSGPEEQVDEKDSTEYEQIEEEDEPEEEEAELTSIVVKRPRRRWLPTQKCALSPSGQPLWPPDHRINPDGGVYLPTGLGGLPKPLGWKTCTKKASRGRVYWYRVKEFARGSDGTLDGPCRFCEAKRNMYNERRRKKYSE